jgi:hypothetical protein
VPINYSWLRSLCEKATPGPWAIPTANIFRVIAPEQPHTNPKQGLSPPYPWRVIADMGDPDGTISDAEFIVAARDSVPELLDLIDKCKAALTVAAHLDTGDCIHPELSPDECGKCQARRALSELKNKGL